MEKDKTLRQPINSLIFAGIFAVAMAYLESAVVVYLRSLYGITEITHSLSVFDPQISAIEVGREFATLVMLFAIGWIAGRGFQSRVGFFIYTFGIWDIFYYLWLKVFLNWPATILDRDLLFLIPLPWWGPVLAPLILAVLMILSGAGAVMREAHGKNLRVGVLDWIVFFGGVLIVLYSFMADALAILPASFKELSQLQPAAFKWIVFCIGASVMGIQIWRKLFRWK